VGSALEVRLENEADRALIPQASVITRDMDRLTDKLYTAHDVCVDSFDLQQVVELRCEECDVTACRNTSRGSLNAPGTSHLQKARMLTCTEGCGLSSYVPLRRATSYEHSQSGMRLPENAVQI